MIFRSPVARRCDRDVDLLTWFGTWHTRFAWLPIRIMRPDVWLRPTGRTIGGGSDWVWLAFYRARYVQKLGARRHPRCHWRLALLHNPETWK